MFLNFAKGEGPHHLTAAGLLGCWAASARAQAIFSLDIQKKIGASLPVAPRMFDLTLRSLIAAATGR